MKRKAIAIVKTVSWMLFILSFSIAAPIVCPPFYYLHIKAMHLPETTGFSFQQIKTAYNEMLRFCIFGGEFSCGDLRWSESGRDHFADCSVLFHLDFIVLAISLILLFIIKTLCTAFRNSHPHILRSFIAGSYILTTPRLLCGVFSLCIK